MIIIIIITSQKTYLGFTKEMSMKGNVWQSFKNDGYVYLFCLFGVLRRFQHCTGHITTGSWKGRGNQYI